MIRELYDLKSVNESEIDDLFDEIIRIKDLYIEVGPSDDLSNRWIKSIVLRNLPQECRKSLAFELKKTDTIEDIRSFISYIYIIPLLDLLGDSRGPYTPNVTT